jgi:hypothetical protein
MPRELTLRSTCLSSEGAVVAFLSGAMLGCGYSLLNNDKKVRDVIRRTIGGAVMTAGLYLWSPAGVRRLWLE